MSDEAAIKLFKRSSTTYFVSSLFFPHRIREAVVDLYAFVRTADNFVDRIPQDERGLIAFESYFWKRLSQRAGARGDLDTSKTVPGEMSDKSLPKAGDREVIDRFVTLSLQYEFDQKWIQAFFLSMQADIQKRTYSTMSETIRYMYGSAEVIGLMLVRIFQIEREAYHAARMLGRSMQFANMIRDIGEDQKLGRQYIPSEQLQSFGLKSLDEKEARSKHDQFERCVREQIQLYHVWMKEAESGYGFLPKRIRVPVMTAASMYTWTLGKIAANPLLVYEKQLKPSRQRVALTALQLFTRTAL